MIASLGNVAEHAVEALSLLAQLLQHLGNVWRAAGGVVGLAEIEVEPFDQ
jgi:hypothetical protein